MGVTTRIQDELRLARLRERLEDRPNNLRATVQAGEATVTGITLFFNIILCSNGGNQWIGGVCGKYGFDRQLQLQYGTYTVVRVELCTLSQE